MTSRKRGNRVSVVLDDDTGAHGNQRCSARHSRSFGHLLVKDEIVVVSGALRYDDFIGGWTINAKNVLPIDRVIESRAKSMVLTWRRTGRASSCWSSCTTCCCRIAKGNCDVSVRYTGDAAAARLSLGPEWAVRPSRELRDKLTELLGSNNVRLLYAPGREFM